ncbi:hypothetical protein [Streptomyces sp. NPDC127038]|uniref:hypothetical protein n=1 Tax=Streptomyces sp. NPDC127038 TaxID=3347114 RepID=UPI003653C89F
MTTTTTVAGRPLSGWTRDSRHGTWHALLPAGSGESELGALCVDRALLAPEGTRERLAAAVLAVARLRLPGVLGAVDLVAEAGEVWLITARPPAPTLTDLLALGDPGPDAGSAASVLNETAQTLLALHAAGLAHGALAPEAVVLAPDGVALLSEAALGTVLGDAPDSGRREADLAAWADLSRALAEAWAVAGSPAAALFARCSALARSEGLAAARAALAAGRAALPADFLRHTELRAAVAAAAVAATEPTTAPTPGPGDAVPPVDDPGPAAPNDRLTLPSRTRPHTSTSTSTGTGTGTGTGSGTRTGTRTGSDDQATVLGKRLRTPVAPSAAPTPGGESDGEIVLRFGPGIPAEDQDALRAQWHTAPVLAPVPPGGRRPRRRRRGTRIATTAFLTAAAVLLWLLLRPSPAPTVTAVEVRAPAARLHCGQTADLVGVITTDGRGGPVTYRWLRSDGTDSGELVRTARRGQDRVTVHLRWTVRGPGAFRGTARLRIAQRHTLPEAEATFDYSCS